MRDETSPIGTPSSVTGRLFRVAAVVGIVWVIGCSDAFNPSFLRMWETPGAEGTSVFTGVSLPSGHIPILFINDARIADNIFRYVIQQADTPSEDTIQEIIRLNPQLTHDTVETILKAIIADQAVDLQQIEHLPPRVRIRVNVTNVDGGVQQLEFVEGLRLARQEDSVAGTPSSGELPLELQQRTATKLIPQCELGQIAIDRIDVFVPTILRVIHRQFDTITGVLIDEVCASFLLPEFDSLALDSGLNANETFDQIHNLDPRFFSPAWPNPQCGGVVVIHLTGDLQLPFRPAPSDCKPVVNPPSDGFVPAYVDLDTVTQMRIPGRYRLQLSVLTH